MLLLLSLVLGLIVASSTVTASRPSDQGRDVLREARVLFVVQFAIAVLSVLESRMDWVHLLWASCYSTLGLFFASGLLFVRVWPPDGGGRGAWFALLGLLVLGGLPVLIAELSIGTRPAGRVEAPALPALLEAAAFGFGGSVPELMEPLVWDQKLRGLGSPPRYVTVPMGTTLFASGVAILFVALAFAGRLVRGAESRRSFFTIAPLLVALTTYFVMGRFEEGLWRNEPWLVKAYGPTVAVALVAYFGLLVAVLLARRSD